MQKYTKPYSTLMRPIHFEWAPTQEKSHYCHSAGLPQRCVWVLFLMTATLMISQCLTYSHAVSCLFYPTWCEAAVSTDHQCKRGISINHQCKGAFPLATRVMGAFPLDTNIKIVFPLANNVQGAFSLATNVRGAFPLDTNIKDRISTGHQCKGTSYTEPICKGVISIDYHCKGVFPGISKLRPSAELPVPLSIVKL